MNKSGLFLTLVSLALITLSGIASTHRLATFNVRYCAPADKGGKEWCNRGPAAISIVTKYDFDVVGFQELSGNGLNNNNSLTGKSQLQEFKESLESSGYTFIEWKSDASDRGYVAIAFKNGKYDLLESGSFFISPTPDECSYGWDRLIATHTRVLGWVKLRDKETDEIFFYAATHTNNGWTLDGIYGSQLVSRRMKEIAGKYPVMIVADYNMQRIPRDVKAYKAYRASFKDAKFEAPAEQNYCLPTTLPPTEGTYGAFNTTGSGYAFKEIDYQFFRRMKILERHIVVDTYDYKGTAYPVSDHCPLFVVAELQTPASPRTIYVDAEASADGDGSMEKPYNSISYAACHADIDDIIIATAGIYRESIKPANTLTLLGGYDKSFTEITGKTIIDGKGLEYPPVYIPENYSFTIKNCELRNYRSSDTTRDGAILFRGCTLTLENCDFTGNEAVGCGGAISAISNSDDIHYYADCNSISATGCTFKDNKAYYGGAIGASFYDTVRFDRCTFDNNEAVTKASALYLDCGTPLPKEIWFTNANAVISNSSFVGNRSTRSGALHIDDQMPNVKFTIVNTTFAGNILDAGEMTADESTYCGGSAILARIADSAVNDNAKAPSSALNVGHVTVTGNRAIGAPSSAAAFRASAINIAGGETRLSNNIIAGNSTTGNDAYADISVDDPDQIFRDMNNVYSTPATVSFIPGWKSIMATTIDGYHDTFTSLMDGQMEEGIFSANIIRSNEHTPYVRLISARYADYDIGILTESSRNLEKDFKIDIDGDGIVGAILNTDQLGNPRSEKSVPGAIEYNDRTSIDHINGTHFVNDISLSKISTNIYHLISAKEIDSVFITDTDGHMLRRVTGHGTCEIDIDLSELSPQLYLITCAGRTFKVMK